MSLKVERSKPSAMVERAWVGGMDCFGQSFGVSLRLNGGVGRFALKTLSGSSSWFGTRWAPDVGDQTTCLTPNKGEEKRGGVKRLRGRTMETKTSKVLEGAVINA
jgi:hypothetical protein